MRKARLEKLAVIVSAVVIFAAAWFWALQVGDVLELLEMAYGE